MDQGLGLWVAPLAFIPGMAILAISTTARYSQLLLFIVNNPERFRLRKQLPLLRYALVSIYVGIAFNAAAAIAGHFFIFGDELSRTLAISLTCLGAMALLSAATCLIMDTLSSELRYFEDLGDS